MPLISYPKGYYDTQYEYLRVRQSDSHAFSKCYNKVLGLMFKGKPISNKLITEFFKYIEDVRVQGDELYSETEKSVIDNVLVYFKDHPDYQFSYIVNDFPTFLDELHDFKRLVTLVVIHMIRQHQYQVADNGKDNYDSPKPFIVDAYKRIDSIVKYIPPKICEYSHYQKTILAAYIAMKFGFHIFDTKKFKITNPKIYEYSWRFVKEFDKKKKPRK